MEDNKHNEECCSHCCGIHHLHNLDNKYHLLRWLLGMVIILVVFWLGFKLGEFKGYFGSYDGGYFGRGYGRGMMMNYFPDENAYFLRVRQQQGQTPWYGGMMWQAPASSSTPSK